MPKSSARSVTAKSLPVKAVLELLERQAPSGSAEAWDNVGLLLGDPAARTRGAVVSVDLTAESLALAKRKGYRLIINHHPCIFPKGKGPSRIHADSLVHQAIRQGVAVISSHTNFDRCGMDLITALSAELGVEPLGRLHEHLEGTLEKLVVFVPHTHTEAVLTAVTEAGAGQIGNYDTCTFATEGEGTFRGRKGTNPFLGKPGELERAREHRLETVYPSGLRGPVLQALRASHPYEEIAYDLLPLRQGPARTGVVRGLGYGFWGDLKRPVTFSELARTLKKVFGVPGFLTTVPRKGKVRRIAFSQGKGSSFVDSALAAGVDVYVTGEVGYHPALAASRKGMTVVELGHRESERFFAPTVCGWLKKGGVATAHLDVPTQRTWT